MSAYICSFLSDRIERRCALDTNRTTSCENAYISQGKRCTCRTNLCNTHYVRKSITRAHEDGKNIAIRMSSIPCILPHAIFTTLALILQSLFNWCIVSSLINHFLFWKRFIIFCAFLKTWDKTFLAYLLNRQLFNLKISVLLVCLTYLKFRYKLNAQQQTTFSTSFNCKFSWYGVLKTSLQFSP